MKNRIFLSIIVPSFNEEDNYKKGALDKVTDYLKKFPYSYEVIIVDDGSLDKSRKLIEEFIRSRSNWRLIKNSHQGKAAAVSMGVVEALGENILFTDFDQATPLSEVEKLFPFLKKGYDIIIGSREIKGARREKEPFYRHLMGKVFNLVVQLIALPGIHDTQCGFKLLKTKAAKDIFSKLKVKHLETKRAYTGAFDVELLFLGQKMGYKIAEVPVFWQHYKTKRVSFIKDSIRMFLDVLRIKLNDLLGKYGSKV
ncbi:glycosyl transferase [Candidatus Beckwithbacteria bacterium CG10_big_fil_rev_8_21_14_0_10_34_10]|uniref:dolichyl-phosphate beta-glucosyltransferase n=1 Tax=Candidatus Beckwithbacteria bacterium CG10_big_fil_rev_8_21_14_0_10_34_10 TaxID=1974495 RepID=A0A2H0WBY1_9BACT|nr:MAG: glycosyl transferase [Candidatus Beckwithbacteria bacterium CG10_big_fil_rev_8_21_14_0_10_34_10]